MSEPVSRAHRVQGGPAGGVLVHRTAWFEPEPASAGASRRLLRGALEAAGRLQWADAATLALSEVVTNAALHAHTPIEVLIEVRADRLCVEVRDNNPSLPRQRQYDEQATTGRGMALVAALTDECGAHNVGSTGKVVWFSLSNDDPDLSPDGLAPAWELHEDEDELDHEAPHLQAVILASMPATLWLAARQHHDALLRELVLYLAEHHDVQVDLALADTARGLVSAAVLHAVEEAQRAGIARAAVPEGHPAPLPPVPDSLKLTVDVPTTIAPAFAALRDALDAAERLAVAGRLLARPGLPEIVAVRDWVCEQFAGQLAGGPGSPWPGTAQRRFETAVNDTWDDSSDSSWADNLVRDAARGVVAADEANRIVAISRPLAALLGWQVADLVGRRVVTLIPPRLREAHVAGFTQHLTSGESHILGVPLVLPVRHADGHELPCHFFIERAPQNTGRSVYLAWIEAQAVT